MSDVGSSANKALEKLKTQSLVSPLDAIPVGVYLNILRNLSAQDIARVERTSRTHAAIVAKYLHTLPRCTNENLQLMWSRGSLTLAGPDADLTKRPLCRHFGEARAVQPHPEKNPDFYIYEVPEELLNSLWTICRRAVITKITVCCSTSEELDDVTQLLPSSVEHFTIEGPHTGSGIVDEDCIDIVTRGMQLKSFTVVRRPTATLLSRSLFYAMALRPKMVAMNVPTLYLMKEDFIHGIYVDLLLTLDKLDVATSSLPVHVLKAFVVKWVAAATKIKTLAILFPQPAQLDRYDVVDELHTCGPICTEYAHFVTLKDGTRTRVTVTECERFGNHYFLLVIC